MKCKKIISCLIACSIIFGSSVVAFADAKSDQLYAAAYDRVREAKKRVNQMDINNARENIKKLKGTDAEASMDKLNKELDEVQNIIFDEIIKKIQDKNISQEDINRANYLLHQIKQNPDLIPLYTQWQGMINNIQDNKIKECSDLLIGLNKNSSEDNRLKAKYTLVELMDLSPQDDIYKPYRYKAEDLRDKFISIFGKESFYKEEDLFITECKKDKNTIRVKFNRKLPRHSVQNPHNILLKCQNGDRDKIWLDSIKAANLEQKDNYTMVITIDDSKVVEKIKEIEFDVLYYIYNDLYPSGQKVEFKPAYKF